jgi:HD-like signal output (HDOD) protein/ActR/RegA family two-component response regulator
MEKRLHAVLFVDDDAMVLRGLRRSLEEYDQVWRADFAASGNEALAKLSSQYFDAVVTDLHMPGMDGIQLLDIVSQQMPSVMRFVLSGNSNEAQMLRSTPLVHQMIAKPCDMEKIYNVVERACLLRDMLSEPHLVRVITGIKTLPSVPMLYTRLVKELQSEDVSSVEIGNIIAQDPAMTAKILQMVNSAFFGLSDSVSSPQRAVSILGLNTVKSLVLGIQVFSEFQGRKNIPVSVDALWKHSMQVSSLSYSIAKDLNLSAQERDDVRVSGILHDVGILLYYKIPDVAQYVRFNVNGLISVPSEYQAVGTSHAEMGGYLLAIWGLPYVIVEAIAFHHQPWLQISKKPGLPTVLYIANGLLNMCQYDNEVNYDTFLDPNYIQTIGMGKYLDGWTAMARELMQNTA